MSQLSLDLHPSLDYQLVVSKRARRASLRVERGRGLIVTIPVRFAKYRVPEFVEQNRRWIEKTQFEQWQDTPVCFRQWPPRELSLVALNLNIRLNYQSEKSDGSGTSEHWVMTSSPEDKRAVAREIAARLKNIAKARLSQRLAAFADLHGLHYRKVSIRGQKTVWGSYSSTGTLSLNYKLLFLDSQLVDYVLLHELAHTVHLDHSKAFWALLGKLDVNAKANDAKLAHAGRQVPPWLELAS